MHIYFNTFCDLLLKILTQLDSNQTSETVHKQSFMDWVETIDALVKEKFEDEENKEEKTKMSAKVLADHFHLTVGSNMQYYSVCGNLHEKAREDIIYTRDGVCLSIT